MNRETLIWAARAFALTVLVLLVATLIAQPLAGRAQNDGAETQPDPPASGPDEPVPDAAGYGSPLVIPAADFSSDGSDPDGFYFDFAGGYVDGSGTACIKAPAYLPAGATVLAVHASVYDNASGNVMVNLRRVNVSSGDSDLMASVSTVENSTAIQQREDLTVTYPDVLYPDYAYYVTTCLNYADHRLYSVRIDYTGP